jgi:nitrate reductase cytochrome c-type subunit
MPFIDLESYKKLFNEEINSLAEKSIDEIKEIIYSKAKEIEVLKIKESAARAAYSDRLEKMEQDNKAAFTKYCRENPIIPSALEGIELKKSEKKEKVVSQSKRDKAIESIRLALGLSTKEDALKWMNDNGAPLPD